MSCEVWQVWMQREQKAIQDLELYWVDAKPTELLAVVEVAGFLGA